MRSKQLLVALVALLPAAAHAGETITYTYDAKGRLTQVAHAGGQQVGMTATYTFDAADNRTSFQVAGATPSVTVVPSGGGFAVIPTG